ncbi:MAG: bifunctional rhamnulose-1-phosphate aldolase/short-chain dehydrogenase [Chloroflexota bacterium]|nr:bifunctional rhamnulose-1-phosphate aldolase/short-chain dehydrogenase [Chloroflexota bacterium]
METKTGIEAEIVENRWASSEAAGLGELDQLVYQSRLLGSDPRLVLWGGGNTSLKVRERDYRGRDVYVLRVKGSGSDLKAVVPGDFPGVRMDDVLPLMEREAMSDEEMVEYLGHTLMDPASPRPSIETLLHAFVPARSVVHSHADAILALTNNTESERILGELFGDRVAVIPYSRPGFLLSKEVGLAVRRSPYIKGVILLNHGLITWDDDPKEAYRLHIEIVDCAAKYASQRGRPPAGNKRTSQVDVESTTAEVEKRVAELAPALRGMLGREKRVVMRFDGTLDVRRLVSGEIVTLGRLVEVLQQGAATPDHILNTKRTPLWIDAGPAPTGEQLASAARTAYNEWVEGYTRYYDSYSTGESMLPPVPRVVLVRGLGMFSVGKDSKAAMISGDIYRHTIAIIEAAERVGGYRSLSLSDAFAAEYWPLELYKLTFAPAEKELSRRVVLITGAAGAIGADIARRFAAEGGHVICADLDLKKAEALAAECTRAYPANRAIAVTMDVTSEESVEEAFRLAVLEYGGIDVVVSNAGIAHSARVDELSLRDWQRSFAVNATGHFLVARKALTVLKAQGKMQETGGSLVFIATKNVTAPGVGFAAYSASKAAEAQLARILALEGGPYGIRSNMVNPDAVFEGSGLWSPEVREQRARAQGIDPSEIEEFYRKRNLLQTRITGEDVAQAALYYAGDRSLVTTGSMLPVDGGLREAFPR